jgi:hypothetical protein
MAIAKIFGAQNDVPDTKKERASDDDSDGIAIADPTPPRLVDEETEKKLIRKLDLRIIPMVMWMYLMSFMDRGGI